MEDFFTVEILEKFNKNELRTMIVKQGRKLERFLIKKFIPFIWISTRALAILQWSLQRTKYVRLGSKLDKCNDFHLTLKKFKFI